LSFGVLVAMDQVPALAADAMYTLVLKVVITTQKQLMYVQVGLILFVLVVYIHVAHLSVLHVLDVHPM
jgi:hypothetical protein